MATQTSSKSSPSKASKVVNGQDVMTIFLTNLEQLHNENCKIQSDLQQAAQEKIQTANEAFQKAYQNEQKSFSEFMAKAQKDASNSGKDQQEAYFKANENFSNKVKKAQENFQDTHTKINEDFSKKYDSKHKDLLKTYTKMYRECTGNMMEIISKSVESNDPCEVIKACQSIIAVSQDAIAKGIHPKQ